MPETKTQFDQLNEVLTDRGLSEAVDFLADQMREEKKYYELFEALKMRVRHQMGLPLTYNDSGDNLSEQQQRELEDGLFEACREVGVLLMKEGHAREGWTFLRPVGDRQLSKELLEAIEVTDENVDSIVEVALSEGVSPYYGFKIVLEKYGTCNSITTFDAEMSRREKTERQAAAGLLVEHLHGELLANVRADIARHEGQEPVGNTLLGLIKDREFLFEGNAYHIDTTHLSSVIRFARMLDNRRQLELAADLAEYGLKLNTQYQYEGEEPFKDIYPSSSLYLNALLGKDVEKALGYFEEKARTQDTKYYGPVAIETYIDLLTRLGRVPEAIEKSIELLPDGPRAGIALTLFELCKLAGDFSRMSEVCREREDLLGFAMSVLHQNQVKQNAG